MTIQFSTKVLADIDFKSPKGAAAVCGLSGDCLVVAYRANELSQLEALDDLLGGAISEARSVGDLDGKAGACTLLRSTRAWALNNEKLKRVLLVGLGDNESYGDFAKIVRSALKVLSGGSIQSVLWHTSSFTGKQKANQSPNAIAERIRLLAQIVGDQVYRFGARQEQFKTKPQEKADTLEHFTLLTNAKQAALVKTAAQEGSALVEGMNLTKDLGNLPPNVCTPTFLAQTALNLPKKTKLKVQVFNQQQIEALGMGSFLAVAKGSDTPPQFIIIRHEGGKANEDPIVLVGKGITFDTGGISLKPGEAMDEMKYDMCGAASVFGTMYAVSLMGLKKNVIGVVPTCENMPSGRATRPGDIVKSMSGQTIEVLNTDAEGRLILCDALTYVERFKPKAVIDVATLTGACIIALGHVHSGLFSDDEVLVKALSKAGHQSLDTVWRLPLDAAYHEQLKSNFADLANIGGRPAGSVTAACFLSRFAEKFRWAHLDIAGTAWKSGAAKGATGRPVPLLLNFLLDQ
ncbi:MAG: leucyl aminopeptidase [Betaproteobacteria bacterium]|nr:leucyl aminopeptidase [Betaproteobacteria bacterium]